MGVLYHLRHPLLALDLLHDHVTRDLLVFQSMQRGSDRQWQGREDYPFSETKIFAADEYPKMFFVEKCYSGDWTNWWIPNRACVEGMLRSAGFTIVEQPEQEVYICRRNDTRSVESPYGSI
jgi:tRNA (mo5U34)-methyltransferase